MTMTSMTKSLPLKVLTIVLLAACSKQERVATDDVPRTPPFERTSPAGQFYALASKGPTPKSKCTDLGGHLLSPIDYEDPIVVSQGVAIYKPKKRGPSQIGVSFITSNSAVIVLYTCAWQVRTNNG